MKLILPAELKKFAERHLASKKVLTLEEEIDKKNCEDSFIYFIHRFWPLIEGRPCIKEWYLEVIAEHLEALYRLEIKNLLINQPFRTGKSLICSVLYPAWLWIKNANLRFVYTTYKEDLTIRDSKRCRQVIKLPLYRKYWGDQVVLDNETNNVTRFATLAGGWRLATSVEGGNTGEGGDFTCFPYEALITTDLGALPIGKIVQERIDCKILSYDHEQDALEFQSIEKYYKKENVSELVKIELVDGIILKCTLDHPIYICGRGYVPAQDVIEGDVVLTIRGYFFACVPQKIKSIKRRKSLLSVFNIDVIKNHNYIANRILVHNCIDDPNNIKSVDSVTVEEATNNWLDRVMTSRVMKYAEHRRLVVQQRAGLRDLSAHIIKKDANALNSSWVKLILPMEYIPSRKCTTVPLPMTNGQPWRDPRTRHGEILCPNLFSEADLQSIKDQFNNDAHTIACQLQQNPTPEIGGIIRPQWFQHWTKKYYPRFFYILQSWDTSLVGKTNAAYSSCSTWGIFKDAQNVNNIMLVGLYADQIEYPDLRKMAIRLSYNYEDVYPDDPIERPVKRAPNKVVIEKKVSGYCLHDDLFRAGIPVEGFNPNRYGSKSARCRSVTDLMERGLVWLPCKLDEDQSFTTFSKEFLDAAISFPSARVGSSANDIIDSTSQAFILLKEMGLVSNTEVSPLYLN